MQRCWLLGRTEGIGREKSAAILGMITLTNVLWARQDVPADRKLTTLVITHDIGVVAGIADEVAVMCGGRTVEHGQVRHVLDALLHRGRPRPVQAIAEQACDIDEARLRPRRSPMLLAILLEGCVFANPVRRGGRKALAGVLGEPSRW